MCYLQSPCCGKIYACRLCHNDAEMHELDRYAVAEIKCTECDTQQGVRAYFQYHVRVVNMRNLLVQLVVGCVGVLFYVFYHFTLRKTRDYLVVFC